MSFARWQPSCFGLNMLNKDKSGSYASYKQISMSKKRSIKSTLAQSNGVLLVIDYTESREDTIK